MVELTPPWPGEQHERQPSSAARRCNSGDRVDERLVLARNGGAKAAVDELQAGLAVLEDLRGRAVVPRHASALVNQEGGNTELHVHAGQRRDLTCQPAMAFVRLSGDLEVGLQIGGHAIRQPAEQFSPLFGVADRLIDPIDRVVSHGDLKREPSTPPPRRRVGGASTPSPGVSGRTADRFRSSGRCA